MILKDKLSVNWGLVGGICIIGAGVFIAVLLAPETGGTSLLPLVAAF